MRRAAAAAFCAATLPAAAEVPRAVLDAVQRLAPTTALEAPLRAAPCAFGAEARHLGALPSNVPWARLHAAVLFDGLPGLAPGHRAVVLRPTRELLARAATRERIAQGGISLHGPALERLPEDAPAPAFLALHVAPSVAVPETCVAPAARQTG
jgi:hypothetical protein